MDENQLDDQKPNAAAQSASARAPKFFVMDASAFVPLLIMPFVMKLWFLYASLAYWAFLAILHFMGTSPWRLILMTISSLKRRGDLAQSPSRAWKPND